MNWKPVAVAAGVGIVVGWLLHSPAPARVETKVVTKEVIRWRTVESIKAGPGSTTTLKPDGSTVISGPVEIGRTAEGSASKTVDSYTKTESPGWTFAASVGALLPRPAVQVGLAWHIGDLFRGRVGVGAGADGEWPLGSYLPNRGALKLILTF